MKRRAVIRLVLVTCAMLLLMLQVLVAGSCEPWLPLTVINQTDQTLTIYVDTDKIGDVKPGAEIKTKGIPMVVDEYLITAKDTLGNIVYSKRYTWEELDKMKWKIIITKSQLRMAA